MPAPPFGFWEEDVCSDSKVTGIHSILLYTGKVLLFHCRSYPFWSRIYDPTTNTMSAENQVVPDWPYSTGNPIEPSAIFCSGHCALPDGRILVAGGERVRPYPDASITGFQPFRGLRYVFIFDPENDSWSIAGPSTAPHIMADGRWYPTLTVLHDGTILTMAGLSSSLNPDLSSKTNRIPEKYIPGTGWTQYSATEALLPEGIQRAYPDGHVIPVGSNKGKVFYSLTALIGPAFTDPGYPHIFNSFATGTGPYWTPQNQATVPNESPAGVLLPIRLIDPKARFLIAGGWWIDFLDTVEIIDLTVPSSDPSWFNIESLKYARIHPSAVILPDRTLFIAGGHDHEGNVMTPELLDTDTYDWINHDLPEMPVGRGYHSSMILLPSGQVFCAGGRVHDGGDLEDDIERRLSIYTPGYLDDGARPVILSEFDPEIEYGSNFEIVLNGSYPLDSICLLKPGSMTHSTDMDQRYVELAFTAIDTGVYQVTAPSTTDGRYLAPPGYYMLFVLKDKSESNSGEWRIPSVGKFIKLVMP